MKHPQVWLIWGNWGPYHFARFAAFRAAAALHGIDARGIEIVPKSDIYEWASPEDEGHIWSLDVNRREMDFRPVRLVSKLWPLLRRERPAVVFVPSYWHWSLACNLMARAVGARVVMMNESHAGTEVATGFKRWIKRQIVRRFHAALVGGRPHRRHFANLGLAQDRVATGYDAVDNDHFSRAADQIRTNATERRNEWGLPRKFILSLGRLVEKKNLPTLIEAFRILRQDTGNTDAPELVIVGSGPLEAALREQCRSAGFEVVDRSVASPFPELGVASRPRVFFYGFRQIEVNPVFYALATVFVLPSSKEEWGLVVNEAMACGLPVIVSRNAGCAEDLVDEGENGFTFDPNDTAELARRLSTIATSAELGSQMGVRSTQIIANWGCDAFADGAVSAVRICAPELFAEKE